MDECLLIFLRNPVLGQVKTRLAAGVGPAPALAVYRALLARTRQAAQAVAAAKVLWYADLPPAQDEWDAAHFAKRQQPPGDLGARLHAAFAEAFAAGHRRVVVVGTDCPELDAATLNAAFAGLRAGADVVLGPATDGGYYLLGMSRFQPALFEGIAWSTDAVAAQTLARCDALGLPVAQLPALSDVDTEADLRRFPQLAAVAQRSGWRGWAAGLLLWLWAAGASAAPGLALAGPGGSRAVEPYLSYWLDSTARAPLTEAQRQQFRPLPRPGAPNFGNTRAALWLRFAFDDPADGRGPWLLELSNSIIDEVGFYLLDAKGKLLSVHRAGRFRAGQRTDVPSNYYVFRLQPGNGSAPPGPRWAYLRVQSSLPMQLPLRVVDEATFAADSHRRDVGQGMYLGLVLIMALYNLFLLASTRDRTYFFYVGSVLASGLIIGDFRGHVTENLYAWPALRWVPRYIYLITAASNVFGLLFAAALLDTRRHAPRLHRGIRVLAACAALTPLPGLLWHDKMASELALQFVTGSAALYLIGVGAWLWRRGLRVARLFTLAWAVLLLGVVAFILQIDGLIPANWLTQYAVQIGSAVETVLLSLALADRINTLKQEKAAAQQQFIAQLRETDAIRQQLARDLHDDLGSTLSSVAIVAQLARQQYNAGRGGPDPAQQQELLERIGQSTQKMLDAMHDIVWTTQHAADSLGNIGRRMREFAGELLDPHDIRCRIEVAPELQDVSLPAQRQYHFYLVFKESLHNVAKYAQASEVHVHVLPRGGQVCLRIEDNGRGFDPAAPSRGSGNGLANMRQRAAQAGGSLQVNAAPGRGTVVELLVPVANPAAAA